MINTGYVIVTERDTNPYSSTYNQTRTRTYEDTTLCPLGWKMYYRIDGNGYNQGQTVYDYLSCSADGIITQADVNSVLYRDYSYDWNLKQAEMGTCVTTIGDSAFTGRAASTSDDYASKRRVLTTVILPDTITAIGNYAFDYCIYLTSLTCNATTPPTLGTDALKQTHNNLVIYVPASSVNAYKAASGWSTYASKIQAIPS